MPRTPGPYRKAARSATVFTVAKPGEETVGVADCRTVDVDADTADSNARLFVALEELARCLLPVLPPDQVRALRVIDMDPVVTLTLRLHRDELARLKQAYLAVLAEGPLT